MPKVRIIVATLAVVMLLLLPAVAQAQPNVHGFYGSVSLNGASVEDGTMVTVRIGGEDVKTTYTSGAEYSIKVAGDYKGETVSFMVGDANATAMETVAFTAGENEELNLNAYPTSVPASLELKPTEGMATTACGKGFTPGRTVTITFDGEVVASISVGANGEFCTAVNPTKTAAGSYTIKADDGRRWDAGTFTFIAAEGMKGDKGDKGDTGAKGDAGATGQKGEDGDAGSGSVMAIVALIIAIIAVILAVVFGMRSKQQPA
jgi:hypothetical protein